MALLALARSTVAADLSSVLAMKAPPAPVPAYDWSGFYLGGHLGYAWGNSNWTTPGISGSLDLFQPFDAFAETGSYFGGLPYSIQKLLGTFQAMYGSSRYRRVLSANHGAFSRHVQHGSA
jgi:opacity protein-like surface antigen